MGSTVWEDIHGQEAVKQTRRRMSVAKGHIQETVHLHVTLGELPNLYKPQCTHQ